jgi:hypothetical protein
MKITVRTVGALRPSRPLTPFEVAQALKDIVGKVFEVEIDSSLTAQGLADKVDQLMGINPAETFDEVVMEANVPLNMALPLSQQNVVDGDTLNYRFYLRV